VSSSPAVAAAPLPSTSLWPRRLGQLYLGLVVYGLSMALQVNARLGLDPWDVFHQGLSVRSGIRLGFMVNLVGALVLLLWIPLRQRPGIGTLSNILVIGLVCEGCMYVLPTPEHWAVRAAFLGAGILLAGVATGLYIGAGLGPGPRDGLMTGLAKRGHSLRVVRTAIELAVLLIGFLLGGTVGIGTLVYAVTIGPLAHAFIPLFALPDRAAPP
jgi:uncharacterized membrane protein YczE